MFSRLLLGVVCIVFVNLRAPEDMQTFGALALMADLLHWMGPPFPQHLNVPTPGLRPLSYPVTLVPHLSWVEPLAYGYRRLMILGGVNTGERFTVTAVDRLGWTIMAADGHEHRLQTNHPALQFVRHGYSEITDRAQGHTYPDVVAVLSSAHDEAANQARAYVQISRAAQGLTFVTNGTQLLAFKLNRQDGLNLIASDEGRATREAGSELAGLASAMAKAEQPLSGATSVKVIEPQRERGMDPVRQISRGEISL